MGRVLDEWTIDTQEFIRTKLPHLLVVALIAFLLSRLLRVHHPPHDPRRRAARAPAPPASPRSKPSPASSAPPASPSSAVITGLQFFAAVGINLGPLLASAGIAGVAIGLAAQNIVKDMLNGILILIEDQFNVGDTVRLAGLSGIVEAMTLRKTTVRDADGTLYVIPNSQITTVANLSVGYSVATVNVSVDFSANPDEVLKLLTSIATDIRNSPDFRQLFVADPQILGVDAIKGSELIFPVVFKTLATKQYGPIREFRRRVRLALEEHHLLPGNPYRVFNAFENRPKVSPQATRETPDRPTSIKTEEANPFTGN